MTLESATDWSDCLVCPICAGELALEGTRVLRCENSHEYDAARQGYFNLLTGRGTKFREDTAEMIAARLRFLGAGHYAPIAEAVAAAVPRSAALIVDAGAGPGYYLRRVLEAVPARAIALDISRAAVKHAAKIPDSLSLVTDVWSVLPIAARTVDVVLNVFAPHNAEEFYRILTRGGRVIVVTPLPEHLQELRQSGSGLLDIQADKQEKLHETFSEGFSLASENHVHFALSLEPQAVTDLIAMGPAGHHEPRPAEREALTVSCGVVVSVFEKN